MQNDMEIVRAFYSAIDAGNLEKAGQFLSDDFKMFGATNRFMDKQAAVEYMALIKAAMPDLKHVLSNIHSEGRTVTLTAQAGGRHTGTLDLSTVGMGEGVIPGSGKMIIFLPEQFEYMMTNGKIVSERNVTPLSVSNGVAGFLKAMGVSDII